MNKCKVLGCNEAAFLQPLDGSDKPEYDHSYLYCPHHIGEYKKFLERADKKAQSFESSSLYPLAECFMWDWIYGFDFLTGEEVG